MTTTQALAESITRQLWTYGTIWEAAPGRSGTFIGHAIAASFFLSWSAGLLILALYRSRKGIPFLSPERNPTVLRRISYPLLFTSIFGLIYTSNGMYHHPHNLWLVGVPHDTMYLAYLFVGILIVLESFARVPADTWRRGLALALFVQSIIWYDHAGHKTLMVDQKFHYTLAWVCFGDMICTAYSVFNPDNVEAYLLSYGLMFLQGTWTVVTGLYTCCIDIAMPLVGAYMLLHMLAIVSVITFVGLCFGGGNAHQPSAAERELEIRKSFSPLPSDEEGLPRPGDHCLSLVEDF